MSHYSQIFLDYFLKVIWGLDSYSHTKEEALYQADFILLAALSDYLVMNYLNVALRINTPIPVNVKLGFYGVQRKSLEFGNELEKVGILNLDNEISKAGTHSTNNLIY